MFYTRVLKPFLFTFDPESVHDSFTTMGESIGRYSISRGALHLVYGYHGRDISKIVDNIHYKTPVLLSAGFDYNARLTTVLPALSFGGAEVGSVTARPCEGNPKPRLRRLPLSQSILVSKGLRNDGVDSIIKRLKNKKRVKDFVVGVSIARTNDAHSATVEAGIEDYYISLLKLTNADVCDYYTINISCPNAFGGETFAEPKLLTMLLQRLSTIDCRKPIYIKMPINLTWNEFDALLKVAEKFDIAGVIIGNLNKDYSSLEVRSEAPEKYQGGLSGKPCFNLSNQFIKTTREHYNHRFTIIGSGGVLSPKDAMAKFEAGADLVQLITGMIYQGPGLIKNICKEYARRYS